MNFVLPTYLYADFDIESWGKQHRYKKKVMRLARFAAERIIVRTRLCESQGHRCCHCARLTHADINHLNAKNYPTVEHIIPKSRGGSDDWENLVMACHACNSRRGSKGLKIEREVWALLEQNGKTVCPWDGPKVAMAA